MWLMWVHCSTEEARSYFCMLVLSVLNRLGQTTRSLKIYKLSLLWLAVLFRTLEHFDLHRSCKLFCCCCCCCCCCCICTSIGICMQVTHVHAYYPTFNCNPRYVRGRTHTQIYHVYLCIYACVDVFIACEVIAPAMYCLGCNHNTGTNKSLCVLSLL